MISLNLSQSAMVQPTEEQLRKRLADAVRARNLLENSDFEWWVGTITKGVEKEYRKLVYRDDEPRAYHKRRGIIQAFEKGLDDLRILASAVEDIEEQIKEIHARTSEPVARGA